MQNALAALDILESENVDLMITDYAMPGMTGAELVKQVRERNPDLKVIIASGYAEFPEGPTRELPRLSKPFTDDDLADAIAEVCCR